jgi:class 3 adenylate cyclase
LIGERDHHTGSITPDAERRQLTVMFADLAGFTALTRAGKSKPVAEARGGLGSHATETGLRLRSVDP